ncbi:MAG TPA: hypothetical protein VG964_00830 [Candidatus Saccharimonadales bacterium]|nr:hypothetical protein [Candidatus Saccharimonadales bacterium]
MSKALAVLSGKPRLQVSKIISDLEQMSGFHSEDVRLLAESRQALRAKMIQLGLDPDDTTGPELYHALITRYDRDARALDRTLGLGGDLSFEQRAKKAAALIGSSVDMHEVWALKKVEAKRLLKQNPPKQLMKRLNYRSIDSLLKREDIQNIFIEADQVEHATWHKKIESALVKLSSASYELREPAIKILDGQLGDSSGVTTNEIIGAIGIYKDKDSVPALTIALRILDGLEHLSEAGFTHQIHSSHPALNWWLGTEHLISVHDGRPVSLNFKDVAANHANSSEYSQRECSNGHHSFWAELMSRYKTYFDELPREIAVFENSVTRSLKPAGELVPEMIEVE